MHPQEYEQFRHIELLAKWEGKVNSTHIQNHFDVSRETARKILQNYCAKHPDNIDYNKSLKGHIPTQLFQCYYSQGSIEEYSQLTKQFGYPNHFHSIDAPLRNLNPEIIRPLFSAIRNKRRLDISYASVSSPEFEERIITPHNIIFSGIRWHVRAYCEKNQEFRDFVLSRFSEILNDEGEAVFLEEHDKKWNTWVDLIIEPDPRLSDARKRIIELDYQMENGQRTLKTRAALLMYLLQKLHLDQYKSNAEAQQIIVNSDCWKKIEQYLPK